jgi:hypothetical protein
MEREREWLLRTGEILPSKYQAAVASMKKSNHSVLEVASFDKGCCHFVQA